MSQMTEVLSQSLFFGAALTLVSFEAGVMIKRRLKLPIFNPFLISALIIIGVLALLGLDYDSYDRSAQHLSFFMTPSTVCLAIPLYNRLAELRRSLAAVAAGITAGVLANIAAIFGLCLLLRLDHGVFVSMLPKSITTPIGLALCDEYGGITSITVLAILFSGITGNMAADLMFRVARIRHPVSRGLALGACAHGIGTAKALELGEIEGAMSGLSIALTGVATVVIAPFFVNLI